MALDTIRIRGARTHNLKNISIDLPRDKLIVITGLSGSGKSSLAFDTIYAEGQRRYVESLSSYARQFLSVMDKPEIDHIEGLSPAISIEQKSTSHNPRSTVGTITEIYDYLRLLYARTGTPRCPDHGIALEAQTISQMVDATLALPAGRYALLAPMVRQRKGEHVQLFEQLMAQGIVRARVNGEMTETDQPPKLELRKKHDIEAVVDRFALRPEEMKEGSPERQDLVNRLSESFETAIRLGEGLAWVGPMDENRVGDVTVFSSRYSCPMCDYALPELEPRLFSFNAPSGACPACDGLGVTEYFDPERLVTDAALSLEEGAIARWGKGNPYPYSILQSLARHYGFSMQTPWKKLTARQQSLVMNGSGEERIVMDLAGGYGRRRAAFEGVLGSLQRRWADTDSESLKEELSQFLSYHPCPECKGARLNRSARNVFVQDKALPELVTLPISDARTYFQTLQLPGWRGEVAGKIVKEICERLTFLNDVGLNYLTLDRRADTLSGGEAQRIRLASQIGAGLVGVMYVLDEPSIGLHQRDNERLLGTLTRLRDLGNTVIVVEHDEDAIMQADFILDIGPMAGEHGGQIMAAGPLKTILESPQSLTGAYLTGRESIDIPDSLTRPDKGRMLSILGASGNNLKNVDLHIPVGLLTCVTGVSGSGKSTLINDTLYALAASAINKNPMKPAPYRMVTGMEQFDKVVDINQAPIGRTPRSNPATYTGLFTPLRDIFAQVPEARARGYTAGRFSFNVAGGRCEACKGDGMLKVEMHFLPDVYVPCDVCHGKRYNRETLDILYKGFNIHEVLDMTVEKALEVFSAVPVVRRKLETLDEVGLSYIRLGQAATTLSGGEAQRVKLSKELSKRGTGQTLYILDEPTTGLHFHDIKHLLGILHKLRDNGNTVVVIEHNLDVIKTADWIVDLGPEGGGGGGRIVAEGVPAKVMMNQKSETGVFLKKHIEAQALRAANQTQKVREKSRTAPASRLPVSSSSGTGSAAKTEKERDSHGNGTGGSSRPNGKTSVKTARVASPTGSKKTGPSSKSAPAVLKSAKKKTDTTKRT